MLLLRLATAKALLLARSKPFRKDLTTPFPLLEYPLADVLALFVVWRGLCYIYSLLLPITALYPKLKASIYA